MDKEELFQPQKKVEQLIFRDELTNVFNRRYLYQYLPIIIENSKKTNQKFWLFMVDIDDFKLINDKFGHLCGDNVLKIVAEILIKSVSSRDIVARYAGDEFTLILLEKDLSIVQDVAKRISSSISNFIFPVEGSKTTFRANLSMGIANFPEDAKDFLSLIDLADKALYVSKQRGKNRLSFVSDIPEETIREKEVLEIFPCEKIIERSPQIERLSSILNISNKERKVILVVIKGDTGTGKSRLMEEFLKHLDPKKNIFFLEKASEKYVTFKYRSLLMQLERYLGSVKLDKQTLFTDITELQLIMLAKALPVLREVYALEEISQTNVSDEDKEINIQEGLKKILINISKQNQLIIVIDDFHWIDENTLNLIISLRGQKARILFCVALREGKIPVSEGKELPIVKLKDKLQECAYDQIELIPLSYEGTREIVSIILAGMKHDEKFNELIYKVSKGNPLFIEELLKFLIQKGFIFYQKGQWGKIDIQISDIPSTLEEVIQERFMSLDKATQQIISKAAVIGQDFNISLLQRFGKENEGYVWDVLESAKRAGLVKESISPFGESSLGEELSFVSDEIRRVLYELISKDEIKSLHQELGETQEGMYSNNLDRIAAELFYHFKKAEDYQRATQYSRMIKDTDGLVYEEAINYAKELLEGLEEKRIAPLSKKSVEVIPDIIRLFYIININTVLFPQGSEMIVKPTEEIFRKLSEIFARDEIILISEAKGSLVVNSERLKEIESKKVFENAFLLLLRNNYIENISFKRGLTRQEFSIFIENLIHPPEDKSLTQVLKSKNVYGIELNEIGLDVSIRKQKTKERERFEEIMLMDYLLSKIRDSKGQETNIFSALETHSAEVAGAISEFGELASKESLDASTEKKGALKRDVVAQSIQKIGSEILEKKPQDWARYKKALAKTILSLEPHLRNEVLLKGELSGVKDKTNVIKELISEFPDDVIVDVLSNEFTKGQPSIARMKNLVQRFLSDQSKRQRLSPILKERLSRSGLNKEDVDWVFGEKAWTDFTMEERVKKFLEISAQDYLSLKEEINMKSLILDTMNQNRRDLFKSILDKWGEFFKTESQELKHSIIGQFSSVIEAMPLSRQDFFFLVFEFVFKELELIKEPDNYALLINQISGPLGYFVDSRNFISVKIFLTWLNKEKLRLENSSAFKKIIQELIANLFPEKRLNIILDELIRRIENNLYFAEIMDIVITIGEPIVSHLMDAAMFDEKELSYLGYFGAYLRRRAIGEILSSLSKKIDKGKIYDELKKRLNDEKWYVVKNTIDLILYLQDQIFVPLLKDAINHPDTNIRKRTIFVLHKLGGKESQTLLFGALNDSDVNNRVSAILFLGEIGDIDALVKLKALKDGSLQAEINKAISSIEKRLSKKKED